VLTLDTKVHSLPQSATDKVLLNNVMKIGELVNLQTSCTFIVLLEVREKIDELKKFKLTLKL
jgi:hypothetical protein